jgi:tetratricopeptide (TPR) repeat protein
METRSGSPGAGEEAIARTTARLTERPGDDAAHAERATVLLDLGRLEEAERDAADAVRIDPDEVRYRELLAEIQSRRGEHADAAAEYARLARRDPRQVAWTVAEAAERMDAADAEKGVEAARRAVRLDPGNFDAQLALARGLVRLGDAASALPAARRAADLRPGDATGRETLADALWLAGREGDAFDEFGALAGEMASQDRERVQAKARSLYRQRGGWFGRLVAATAPIFAIAFRRGWLTVR